MMTDLRGVVVYFIIGGFFELTTTFGGYVIYGFGFGEGCFDELLHGIFVFLHVGVTDAHFFGDG